LRWGGWDWGGLGGAIRARADIPTPTGLGIMSRGRQGEEGRRHWVLRLVGAGSARGVVRGPGEAGPVRRRARAGGSGGGREGGGRLAVAGADTRLRAGGGSSPLDLRPVRLS